MDHGPWFWAPVAGDDAFGGKGPLQGPPPPRPPTALLMPCRVPADNTPTGGDAVHSRSAGAVLRCVVHTPICIVSPSHSASK